jgi:hypothetical protein
MPPEETGALQGGGDALATTEENEGISTMLGTDPLVGVRGDTVE